MASLSKADYIAKYGEEAWKIEWAKRNKANAEWRFRKKWGLPSVRASRTDMPTIHNGLLVKGSGFGTLPSFVLTLEDDRIKYKIVESVTAKMQIRMKKSYGSHFNNPSIITIEPRIKKGGVEYKVEIVLLKPDENVKKWLDNFLKEYDYEEEFGRYSEIPFEESLGEDV